MLAAAADGGNAHECLHPGFAALALPCSAARRTERCTASLTAAPLAPPPPLPCSLQQARRLLAAAGRLPVEMRIQLGLHARSEPAADWHSQLLAVQRVREVEAALPAPPQHAAALQAATAAVAAARKCVGARTLVPARRLQHA